MELRARGFPTTTHLAVLRYVPAGRQWSFDVQVQGDVFDSPGSRPLPWSAHPGYCTKVAWIPDSGASFMPNPERAFTRWRALTPTQNGDVQKVMTTTHKHSGATSRSAAVLYRELSLCIRPSSTATRTSSQGPASALRFNYLSRLSAGRGVRSWRWMVSRHGARSPARRAPCRRSRTTLPSR